MRPSISICTPTNSARWLKRVAWSLSQQTDKPEEWVLIANGSVTEEEIRDAVADLKGVDIRVIRAPLGIPATIGALKRFAFTCALGDGLLELDHDDALAPDCVAEVRAAFEAGAEFVYSNMVAFFGDEWQAEGFWPADTAVRPCTVYGRSLLEGVADFTPHNILVASHSGPCHVRAWARELYKRLGGHDESVNWTEDLELLARTYLAHPKVAHIDKPLYAFYVDPARSRDQSAAMLEEIPYWTQKHALALVHEWCARNGYADVIIRAAQPLEMQAGHVSIESETPERLLPLAWNALRHGGFVSLKVRDFGAVLRHWFPVDPSESARFQLSYGLPRDGGLTDILMIADKQEGRLAGVNHWQPLINAAEVERWLPVLKTYGTTGVVSNGRCLLYGEESHKAAAFMSKLRAGCFVAADEAEEAACPT